MKKALTLTANSVKKTCKPPYKLVSKIQDVHFNTSAIETNIYLSGIHHIICYIYCNQLNICSITTLHYVVLEENTNSPCRRKYVEVTTA